MQFLRREVLAGVLVGVVGGVLGALLVVQAFSRGTARQEAAGRVRCVEVVTGSLRKARARPKEGSSLPSRPRQAGVDAGQLEPLPAQDPVAEALKEAIRDWGSRNGQEVVFLDELYSGAQDV